MLENKWILGNGGDDNNDEDEDDDDKHWQPNTNKMNETLLKQKCSFKVPGNHTYNNTVLLTSKGDFSRHISN